jgi:hypothetical protein
MRSFKLVLFAKYDQNDQVVEDESWAGHVVRMGAKRNKYRILVRRPEGKRLLGNLVYRWVDNIKMDLREIG